MARSIYRDSLTGYFVSKETYNRSQSQGGERYHRETFYTQEEKQEQHDAVDNEMDLDEFIDQYGDEPDEEIVGAFDYKKKS